MSLLRPLLREFAGAMRKRRSLNNETLALDPAALIRQQIISLIQSGHDVQLLLHQAWHGARYEAGKWLLHPDKKTVDSLFETQAEVNDYIAARKKLIEEMVANANSARKVRVYRAGAFSRQPGQKLLTDLAKNAISIENSVVKGLHSANNYGLRNQLTFSGLHVKLSKIRQRLLLTGKK